MGVRAFAAFFALLSGLAALAAGTARATNCDVGISLTKSERGEYLSKLRISKAGRKLLRDFTRKYGSLDELILQWSDVSYSQIATKRSALRAISSVRKRRAPASAESAESVCVHLARKLPDIEHIADFAHELVHATKLSREVLYGLGTDSNEFVKGRIEAKGGEAEAFATECVVKRELLGRWDSFCAPYARNEESIDVDRVVQDLYSGQLSASLTGEPYPVMLQRQFESMHRNQN